MKLFSIGSIYYISAHFTIITISYRVCFRTLLQFSKKKRKRSDSDDDYGDDYDPEEGRRRRRGRDRVEEEEEDMQDSPKVDELKEKRRSARSRKATKYVDDTDYGFEDEGDNAVNIQIPNENSTDGKIVSEAASEVGAEGTPSATPSVAGGDPEASNASSAPGTTVPGTPAEGTLDASTNQSGPNYAFVVSACKIRPLHNDIIILIHQYLIFKSVDYSFSFYL